MDIGSVRLHERHLRSDPPTPAEVAACVADIDGHLDALPGLARREAAHRGRRRRHRDHGRRPGCSTCAAYDRDAIDQAGAAGRPTCTRWSTGWSAMTVAERLALPWLHPGRADVIGAGALILSRVLRRTRGRDAGRLRGRHPRRDRLVPRVSRVRAGVPAAHDAPTQTDEPLGAVVHRLSEQIPSWSAPRSGWPRPSWPRRASTPGVGIGLFSGGRAPGALRRWPRCSTTAVIAARPRAAALAGRADRDRRPVRGGRRRGAGRQEAGQPGHPAGAREGDRRRQAGRRGREGDTTDVSRSSPAELEADIARQREAAGRHGQRARREQVQVAGEGPPPKQAAVVAGVGRGRSRVVVIVVKRRRS